MDLKKLVDDLNGADETDRLYAAEDLGDSKDEMVVGALTARLQTETSRAVKEAIFHALKRIGGERVIRAAILLLEDDDAFLRNESVSMLSSFGVEALPALAAAICDPDCDTRKFALDALAMIVSPMKDEIYRQVLSDADINIVITAVEHIGRDNRVALRPAIEAILEKATHPMLLAACVDSLSQIGNAGSLDAMYHKLGGERMSDFAAPGFIRALGNLGTAAHIDMLGRLLERFPATLADSGLDAITALQRQFPGLNIPSSLLAVVHAAVVSCPDSLGKIAAMRVLAVSADEETSDSVRSYLQSHDKLVRLAAVVTIAQSSTAAVKTLLANRKQVETDEDVLAAIEAAINEQTRNAA